jgi:hypothetical protein
LPLCIVACPPGRKPACSCKTRDIDIVVNNHNDVPSLLRNDGGNHGSAIQFKCVGTRSNRSAVGTRVKVVSGSQTQIDEICSGSSFLSQNDLRLHFGLGTATKAELVEVRWPSGSEKHFETCRQISSSR